MPYGAYRRVTKCGMIIKERTEINLVNDLTNTKPQMRAQNKFYVLKKCRVFISSIYAAISNTSQITPYAAAAARNRSHQLESSPNSGLTFIG
jgi:hypothetical protein